MFKKTIDFTLILVLFLFYGCGSNGRPPRPTILTSDGKRIAVFYGSYCWESKEQDICVDTIHPCEYLKNKKPFTVLPETKIIINFAYPPKKGTLGANIWICDKGTKPIGQETIRGNSIYLPKEKGKYVYDIYAYWEEGSGSFSFIIKVE